MQVENHKEEVPFAHYAERFRQLDPEEASRRTGVKWKNGKFYVNLLDREYAISHPVYAIESHGGDPLPPLFTQTFLLRFLLEGQDIARLGQWKTFRELPWGETYQKAFSGRILRRTAFAFGRRMEAFRSACEKLGGTPVDRADAGYEINLMGPYALRILLWEGDEEFPPSAQILYSDNFAQGFTAEDRVVAAELLLNAIQSHL